MRIKFTLCAIVLLMIEVLSAQHWASSNMFASFAVNAVDVPRNGYIVTGGGKQSQDSFQIMFTLST